MTDSLSGGPSSPLVLFGVLLIVAALLGASCDDQAPTADDAGSDAGASAPSDAGGERPVIVWFGAHPDDELYVAAYLAERCLDGHADCRLVVATRGEGGGCNLAGGCSPDLATVRAMEMAESARILGAELVHWELSNGGSYMPSEGDVEGVLTRWAGEAGTLEALLGDITEQLRGADEVLVHDLRHGSSCHPEHRAMGALVTQAALDLGDEAPRLVFAEGVWDGTNGGFQPMVSDDAVQRWDATARLSSTGEEAWSHFVDVLVAHASQFAMTPAQAEAARNLDASRKGVFLLDAADAMADDPRYGDLCPPSTF